MDQFIRSQNIERYRPLLVRVTENQTDRQLSICLPKNSKSKKTSAIQFNPHGREPIRWSINRISAVRYAASWR